MAKTGFWLQGAKGKFAGAALQKGAFGGTIMRQITTPKNPRTIPQMIQRIITATVAQAYADLKGICDHSFEGVTYGAQSMARFRSLNAKALKEVVNQLSESGTQFQLSFFNLNGEKHVLPNKLILSQGSLNSFNNYIEVSPRLISDGEGGSELTGYQLIIDGIGNKAAATVADLKSRFNLQTGDQITLVAIGSNADFHDPWDSAAINKENTRLVIDRVLVPADDTEKVITSNKFLGSEVFTANDQSDVEDPDYISLAMAGASNMPLAFGIIVSRKVGNEWLRSNCTMAVAQSTSDGGSDYNIEDFQHTLGDALASYENSGLNAGSNLYLNNARS